MSKKPTIYDIAAEAGVSVASVSRVLAGKNNVSASLKAKVLTVTEKYHYLPSVMAQGLEHGSNKTIGVIMPPVVNPYYSTLFSAANEAARELGYATWLHQFPMGCNTVDQKLVDHLISLRLSGVLLAGGFSEKDADILRSSISLLKSYMPVVAICHPLPDMGCPCFYNDFETAITQSVIHLHTLGHTRIGFLGGPIPVGSSARGQAYLKAMKQLDLACPSAYTANAVNAAPAYDEIGGARVLQGMFASLGGSPRPTALICYNDLVAIGALRELHNMGLSVPEDMALIGCDNIAFTQYTSPPLTTIDIFPVQAAKQAVMALVNDPDDLIPMPQMLESAFVIRESCGSRLGRRVFPE